MQLTFLDGFWYKTIFPSTPVTGHGQSDVEFYGESYDDKYVAVSHCLKNFEKVENHEYARISEQISAFF